MFQTHTIKLSKLRISKMDNYNVLNLSRTQILRNGSRLDDLSIPCAKSFTPYK